MINAIVLETTSMGLVAFGGLGYMSMYDAVYTQYATWLNVYLIFISGVGLGVCMIGLWNSITEVYLDYKD